MDNKVLNIALRWLLILAVDIFILSKLQISVLLHPHIYMLTIILMPVRTTKAVLLIFAFFTGLVMDIFLMTGGLHAASLTFMAFIRILVLRAFISPEDIDANITPTLSTIGNQPAIIYNVILIGLHLLFYFVLEIFRFSSLFLILSKLLVSLSVCLILALTIQYTLIKAPRKNERRRR